MAKWGQQAGVIGGGHDRGVPGGTREAVGEHFSGKFAQQAVAGGIVLARHLHRQHPARRQQRSKAGQQRGMIGQPVQGGV